MLSENERKIRDAIVFVAEALTPVLLSLNAVGRRRFEEKYYNTAIINELSEQACIASIGAGMSKEDFVKNCGAIYEHIVVKFGKPDEPPGRRDN